MKESLLQYARYNIWANAQLAAVLLKLTEEQLDMEIQSSFPSIRKTVYHMWSAEDIWLQRLNLVEQAIWAETGFSGDFKEAMENWTEASRGLAAFIDKQFNDAAFLHVMQYYNLKKQSVKLPVHVCLMQVLNHASYHRGQLVTMLRQVGVKKIPATDFFVFASKYKA